MMMKSGLRKFALTLHVTASVGWIGAVAAYLALVLATMTSRQDQLVRAAWIAMNVIGWYVIVPLALAALLTGLVMALGTPWGLFRQYWVVVKLILTALATIVLLLNMQTISTLASAATEMDSAELAELPNQLLHPGVGLLVLIVITVLSIYKPRGLTPYGWRRQQAHRSPHR